MNEIMQLPNVVGFGKGYKFINGEEVGEAIIVLVTKKYPLNWLATHEVIPKAIDGNVTDVIEVGHIKAQAYNHRLRPIQPGISIGHPDVSAGTLGAIVKDVETGDPLILSNAHVLADSGDGFKGDPILQPGVYDNGHGPEDVIGYLKRFAPIYFGEAGSTCPIADKAADVLSKAAELIGSSHRLQSYKISAAENRVDCAVAAIAEGIEFNPEILDIGNVEETTEVSLGDQVQKTGRTTEHTTGAILIVEATVQVDYGAHGTATFVDQIIAGPMSAGGDSGSLGVVIDEFKQALAFGLLFAGSEQVTIFNPIHHVLNTLNVKF